MALNFNLTQIKNYEAICYDTDGAVTEVREFSNREVY